MGDKELATPRKNRLWIALLIICAVGAGIYIARTGMSKQAQLPQKGAAAASRPTPVTAAPARKGEIGVYITALGTVTPLNTVTVRSRVDGQLMKVHYREGQTVKSGDLLAEIDPRPFEVQLAQAEGQMAKDLSLLKNARLDLERYQLLAEQDSIARQQRDSQEALVRQYEGTVKSDQSQIDGARLQMHYARITAPIGGRIGLRLVDPGNIIHASDPGGLVVITQLQPISVVFSIPEDSLPQVLKRLGAGERLAVDIFDREQKQKLAAGHLLTADNQIDTATGTVKLKALFANAHNELFPNQFVNARLLVELKRESILVPAAAIQRGPQGTFVFVVKDDGTAAARPVTIGVSHGGDTAVAKGLEAGERVVVDGAERLRDGGKVELKGQDNRSGKKNGPR